MSEVHGLKWNTIEIRLVLKQVDYRGNVKTRKELVNEAAKVCEVLGLWLAVTVRSRILIQNVGQLDLYLDGTLQVEIITHWTALAADLTKLSSIEFPLNIFVGNYIQVDIYRCECISLYGAVAYVTSRSASSIILARARVSPIKKLTLPQLE